MQFNIIFLFCLIAVAVAGPTSRFKEIADKCQNDPATHLDESVFDKLRAGEKVDDPKLGPHMLCINIGHGIQKENGDIDLDVLKKDLEGAPEYIITRVVNKCGQRVAGSTVADAAIALAKCVRDAAQGPPDHD